MDSTLARSAAADRARTASAGRHARIVFQAPFIADTWMRLAYLLLAVPVGLLCLPLGLIAPGTAGRLQRAMAHRLLRVAAERPRRVGALAFAHAVLTTPLNVAGAVVSLFLWSVVAMNVGYPLRPGLDPTHAWGGPTLAGAWAIHAVFGGLAFLLLTPWVMKGLTSLQARLVTGFLGTNRAGLVRPVGLALAVAVVCALLGAPVIQQL